MSEHTFIYLLMAGGVYAIARYLVERLDSMPAILMFGAIIIAASAVLMVWAESIRKDKDDV